MRKKVEYIHTYTYIHMIHTYATMYSSSRFLKRHIQSVGSWNLVQFLKDGLSSVCLCTWNPGQTSHHFTQHFTQHALFSALFACWLKSWVVWPPCLVTKHCWERSWVKCWIDLNLVKNVGSCWMVIKKIPIFQGVVGRCWLAWQGCPTFVGFTQAL